MFERLRARVRREPYSGDRMFPERQCVRCKAVTQMASERCQFCGEQTRPV